MAIIPRSTKAFLFMLGVLTCIVINSRNRFDHLQFIGLIGITFAFTVLTWVRIFSNCLMYFIQNLDYCFD